MSEAGGTGLGAEPRRFGRYVEVRVVGEGGMGEVIEAEDTRLGRRVAIKLMAPSLVGDPDHRARFLREARVAASVSHPNLAGLYDVGEDGDRVWLVMELARGRRARALVEVAPDPQLLVVAYETACALAALHAAGVVHRDLKPENIHVDAGGAVKVLDFGLARPLGEDADAFRSRSGQLSGTPVYMAPELWRRAPATPASDVYAFGVLVHELVTGHRAWAGWTPAEGPDAPRWARVPAGLAELVAACVAVDPAQRPADGAALAARLRPLVAEGVAPGLPEAGLPGHASAPAGSLSTWMPAPTVPPGPRAHTPPPGSDVPPSPEPPALLRSNPTLTEGPPAPRAAPRWPWIGALAALLGVGVAVAALTGRGGDGHVATDTSPGTDVTELPVPALTQAGRDAWTAAMTAYRTGDRTRLLSATAELVAGEPELAEGWLLRATALYLTVDREAAQEAFGEAFARAPRLSARDRALLDSYAPLIQAVPPDRTEAIRRAEAAATRWPADAELQFVLAQRHNARAELDAFGAASTEALRLDPGFAWVHYARAKRFAAFSLDAESAEALTHCADAEPPAPICLRFRAERSDLAGDCPAVRRDLSRELNLHPADGDALRRRASLLLREGKPAGAVSEALRLAWEAGAEAERGATEAAEARIAAWEGRFADALAAADAWDAAVTGSAAEADRVPPRWFAVEVAREAGDLQGAADRAQATLDLLDAWSPDRDQRQPTGRHAPALRRVLVDAGRMTPDAYARWLAAWEEARLAEAPLTQGPIWFWSRAVPARTAADAATALAELPRFGFTLGPAVGHSTDRTIALGIGRVQRLAALPDARASLSLVGGACLVLDAPLVVVQAEAELARLDEAAGDVAGACGAWGEVLTHWGSATPRSVTAEAARDRRAALGCP